MLTLVDAYTRECLALDVGARLRGEDVATILTRVVCTRGVPTMITVDNGEGPAPFGCARRSAAARRRDARLQVQSLTSPIAIEKVPAVLTISASPAD